MKVVPHDSATGHVAGTADYVDDRPFLHGELHVGVVLSQVAHGKIRSIETTEALKVPGVAGVWTAKDLHHNLWGTIFQDQPVLAGDTVQHAGEPIAIVAAESLEAMKVARKLIQVTIDPLEPVLTISESIKRKIFIGPIRTVECGDPDGILRSARHRLEGIAIIGGQDHFYLESQASIAYPGEDGQMEIHSSSQHPTEVQHVVAHALGLKYNDVVCTVKRMGGGFGGKESQAAPFAAMAALVAQKTGRAARVVLTKDEDMFSTGKRHPFENHWKVAFDDDGRILALTVDLYSDAGAYADLSTAIMERAMLHIDNAYYIPNARIRGHCCRTNLPSNTAFRGFGGPQGVATIESIIEDIARVVKRDPYDIRRINCYQGKNNRTPYGQVITQDMLPRLFDHLEKSSDYRARRKEVEKFNQQSKTHLKGLSMTAVKFGISFTTRFLNQGAALVNIHMDGTIQVSTGATEMGQGVNTKVAQAVASSFGLTVADVRVMPTSTEKIPNTSPTAASSGADINGAAAVNACGIIKRRLQLVAEQVFARPLEWRGRPVAASGRVKEIVIDEGLFADHIVFEKGEVIDSRKAENRMSFTELLGEVFLNRISLSAQGFFRYPGIHYNKETGKGDPFFYFTNGVAVSEVSICRFTGEVKILRVDILMDLGRPLNRGVDLGQVTGGFVQGAGWVTTEKLVNDAKGRCLTISPSTYKIPNIQDTPRDFRVELLENDENLKNFAGNKAVGEPPLLLGVSVWTAVKDALQTSLRLPATQEEILNCLEARSKMRH